MSDAESPVEQLLAALSRELEPIGWRARCRALAEAHDHLLSAIEDEVAKGADRARAEEAVVARFGEPALIAESLRLARPRRLARTRRVVARLAFALAFAALGAAMLRLDANRSSARTGASADRIVMVGLVALLACLPLVAGRRRIFGPVGDSWPARLVRIGAYGALCALPLVVIDLSSFAGARFDRHTFANAADKAQWQAEQMHSAIFGSVVLFSLIALYATVILWVTSRRASAGASTLAAGGCCGIAAGLLVYALAPFGGVWHVNAWLTPLCDLALPTILLGGPLVAGMLAGGRTSEPRDDPFALSSARIGQGLRAGLCAGAVAALLIAVLTVPTMVQFPHRVPLKWANPDPDVPHGGTFEVEMSVGDGAQKYLVLLVLGPLIGAGLGAAAADARGGSRRVSAPLPPGSARAHRPGSAPTAPRT